MFSPQLDALVAAFAEADLDGCVPTFSGRAPSAVLVLPESGSDSLPAPVSIPVPYLPAPARSRIELILALAATPFSLEQDVDGVAALECRSGFAIAGSVLSALENPGVLAELVELMESRGVTLGK